MVIIIVVVSFGGVVGFLALCGGGDGRGCGKGETNVWLI